MNNINSKVDKLKAYLLYSLGFAVLMGIIFAFLYFTGNSPVYKGAALTQYFPAQFYFMKVLKGGVLPWYNFNIGFGQDSLIAYHAYGMSDPLTILIMFLQDYMPADILYFASFTIRLYLAGLAFIYMTFYFEKNREKVKKVKLRKFDFMAVCLGAWIYVFSSYGISNAFMHPMLINAMIIFPLIVVSLHRLIDRGRVINFILLNTVSIVMNVYLAAIISVAGLVYAVIELGCRFTKDGSGRTFKTAVRGLLSYIISLLLSAFVLLPVSYGYLHGSKLPGFISMNCDITLEKAGQFLLNIFQTPNGDEISFIGVCAVVLVSLIILAISKGYTRLKIFTVASLVLMVNPRWCFAIVLLFAFVFVTQYERMFRIKGKKMTALMVLGIGYIALAQWFYTKDFRIEYEIAIVFMIAALVMVFKKSKNQRWYMFALVCAILCANVAFFSYEITSKEYVASNKVLNEMMTNKRLKALANLTKGSLDRIDNSDPLNANFADIYGYPSSTIGYTLGGRVVSENFDNRAILDDILSVKYYIDKGDKKVPYGFEKLEGELFVNKNFIPFGFTYDKFIKPFDLRESSILDQQNIMMKAVILEENPEGIKYLGKDYTRDLSLKKTEVKFTPLDKEVSVELTYPGEVYMKSKDELKNLGYFGKGVHKFPVESTEGISFECRSLDFLAGDAARLGREHLTDIKILPDGFSGKITTDGNKMLFVSVPFARRSWNAQVDEINTKIYRANEGFMAVKVRKGTHNVEFRYSRPFQKEGVNISALGVVVLIAFLIFKSTEKEEVI